MSGRQTYYPRPEDSLANEHLLRLLAIVTLAMHCPEQEIWH